MLICVVMTRFWVDLIIDVSGANSISGGAGNDYIFSIESDAARFDGSDTVNGGSGDDLLFLMTVIQQLVATEGMHLSHMPTHMTQTMNLSR